MTVLIPIIFLLGYAAIALEHPLRVNKAATAMLTGVLCWSAYALGAPAGVHVPEILAGHLSEVAGILFFLMGAMTIVELIDAHDGFQIVVDTIRTSSKRKLVWIIAVITFFLSAVIDNLTTTIVLVSLVRKVVTDRGERLALVGLVIIAANAGGAWSPIGDVTTTMLWIGGQVTTGQLMLQTFLASVMCTAVPAFLVTRFLHGHLDTTHEPPKNEHYTAHRGERNLVFGLGIGLLLFVPVFKTVTHLPPFMGMLFALGTLWVVTEMIHSGKDEEEKGLLSVSHALRKIDTPSVLFFLGILLAVGALRELGTLAAVAGWMDRTFGNIEAIVVALGLLSAVVDNVPLVAGAQGMYPLGRFPTDHFFWTFLAYCAGTGGSLLIIGSAAGVVAMGLEKIEFFWYLRRIGPLAAAGYFAGVAVYLVQRFLFHL